MRCIVRIILLTIISFILIIYFAVTYANSKIVVAFDENDEEARRILESAVPSAQSNQAAHYSNSTKATMSVSVALVLIVSLISVALLITGIIIIAITLDPSTPEDEESDLEPDDDSQKSCSLSNGYYPLDMATATLIDM